MISIPVQIFEDMIAHARELDPHECCGILAGQDGQVSQHYRIKNILANMAETELARFDQAKLSDLKQLSPEERADIAFQMDAQEMAHAQKDIRQKGILLKAFYHSHTFSPARPSVTDIKIAMEFESYREKLNIPEPLHIIVSLEDKANPIVRAYRIQHSKATEVPVTTH
ncbi:MAG: M67 family metallopeptidase [Nitrospirota bacterium]|nr:M67 family metallopeptidase [Nitrospirota bacterium]